jgi:hypothetical protein
LISAEFVAPLLRRGPKLSAVELPLIVKIDCPACGERVDIVLGLEDAARGSAERRCCEGHRFWVHVDQYKVHVSTKPP